MSKYCRADNVNVRLSIEKATSGNEDRSRVWQLTEYYFASRRNHRFRLSIVNITKPVTWSYVPPIARLSIAISTVGPTISVVPVSRMTRQCVHMMLLSTEMLWSNDDSRHFQVECDVFLTSSFEIPNRHAGWYPHRWWDPCICSDRFHLEWVHRLDTQLDHWEENEGVVCVRLSATRHCLESHVRIEIEGEDRLRYQALLPHVVEERSLTRCAKHGIGKA